MSDDDDNHDSSKDDGDGANGAKKKRPLTMQLGGHKKKKKKRPRLRDETVASEFASDPPERAAVHDGDAPVHRGEPLVIPAQQDTFKKAAAASAGGDNVPENSAVKKEDQDAPNLNNDDEATAAAVRALQIQAGADGAQQPNGSNSSSSQRTIRSNIKNELQETQQYKADLERLPDELSETAEAYQAVPIAEFGAALLRGMGWSGEDDNSSTKKKNAAADDTVLPRPHRLGLGAIPAAVAHADDNAPSSRRGRRPDQYERHKSVQEQQRKYQKEREAQVAADKQRTLQNGSLVLLQTTNHSNNHHHPPRRARIQKLVGVPGLNRVSVVLENSDAATTIQRNEIDRLLTRRELEEQPFREPQQPERERNNKRSDDRTSSKTRSKDRDSSRGSDDRSREKDRKKRRQDDDEKGSKGRKDDQRSSKSKSNSGGTSRKRPRDERPIWIIPHIRVRVITEKLGRRHYKQKGVVVDVTPAGATLQMDGGGGGSHHNSAVLLDHVPERYLETALPKVGGHAVVLAGRHRHTRGRLLERTSREGVLQDDEMNLHTLSLDDLAEWCGPRDE